MKLAYKGWCYKSMSVLRFYMARLYHGKKFRCPEMSMIGNNSGIHILEGGKINCQGRIIIDDHVMLYAKGTLQVGKSFCINRYSRIVAHKKIEIGDHVTIGQMVGILDHDHYFKMDGEDLKLDGYSEASIKIGNHIWIGDKCTILKGVTIGDNVVVGANTLVNKDVPSGVIIGGSPFKILKRIE